MRISKQDLESRVRTLESDNTIRLQAMNDAIAGKIQWFASKAEKETGLKYRFGVSRLCSANGGLFYTVTTDQQGDSYTQVQYLDNAYAWIQRCDGSQGWGFMHEPIMQAFRLRNDALAA